MALKRDRMYIVHTEYHTSIRAFDSFNPELGTEEDEDEDEVSLRFWNILAYGLFLDRVYVSVSLFIPVYRFRKYVKNVAFAFIYIQIVYILFPKN